MSVNCLNRLSLVVRVFLNYFANIFIGVNENEEAELIGEGKISVVYKTTADADDLLPLVLKVFKVSLNKLEIFTGDYLRYLFLIIIYSLKMDEKMRRLSTNLNFQSWSIIYRQIFLLV
jgi:hypothetical protein